MQGREKKVQIINLKNQNNDIIKRKGNNVEIEELGKELGNNTSA